MTGYLYNQHTLAEFREGITTLFLTMEGLFDDKRQHTELDVLIEKLEKVDQNEWVGVRRKLELADMNSKDTNLSGPAQTFLAFMKQVDQCQRDITTKLESLYNKDNELTTKINDLQESLRTCRNDLDDAKVVHHQDRKELNTSKAMLEHLSDLCKQKNERIQDLERGGTVQIWEKEKSRVMEKYLSKNEELNNKIFELNQENERLKRAVKNAQKMEVTQAKMEKIKEEQMKRQSEDEIEQENDELKRKVYTMERDLLKAEEEVHKNQKYMIGCVTGLKRDFKILIERVMGEKGLMIFDDLTKRDIANFQTMIEKVLDAVTTGRLGALRADLPDHYIALDKDVKGSSMKRLSVQYNRNVRLLPMSAEDNIKTAARRASCQPTVNGKKPAPLLRMQSDLTDRMHALDKPLIAPIQEQEEKSNPEIMTDQGEINHTLFMRHFPLCSKTYIKQQWALFCTYDTSGDGKLDLTELVAAMNKTIGEKFEVEEIKDAMNEVDLDHNQEIDFFEYLKIADMLMHKLGNSTIFQHQFIRDEGRKISKTCSVM